MWIWPVLSRQHSFCVRVDSNPWTSDLKVGCRPPSLATDAASYFFFCRTSLFKGCSALYCLLLVVTCVSFLSSEVVTNSVPLHYFEVTTSYPPTIETYHIDSEGFHVHDYWWAVVIVQQLEHRPAATLTTGRLWVRIPLIAGLFSTSSFPSDFL